MKYRKAFIYYMSGTGNTYRVANWMRERLLASGVEVALRSMEEELPCRAFAGSSEILCGVLMPTHAFTAPWQVIKFAAGMPRGRGARGFVCASRASGAIGRFIMPGLSGTALFVIALIMLLKGYGLRGLLPVNMPSNWTSIHPALSKKMIEGVLVYSRPRVEAFIDTLISGRRRIAALDTIAEFVLGLALSPLSALFLVMGRFFLAKLFFANSKCIGCGQCAQYCPLHAVRMRGKPPRPFWRYDCESCMRCMFYCPREAVEWGHSWGVILYFITAVPVNVYVLEKLSGILGIHDMTAHMFGGWIITWLWFMAAILVSYAIFYLLIRFPIANRLFTYTTFTHYWKRHPELEIPLKELGRPRR